MSNLISAALFNPISIQAPNAWMGHLPFAYWLMNEVKPKIFVELGTHTGYSYFSFCQSVAESNLLTKCYAVDTWQGDEHAGCYDDEVYGKVNAHNQEYHAEFSRLMKMTFDDAVSYFEDASIELLHIDGLHTYEAVKHDFETWLPKLAPDAVVMFHDTNVRERGFGVWKLWEELRAIYPNNLEFLHSHGLGILQINSAPEDMALPFLQPNFPEKQVLIRYFSGFGLRSLEQFELNEIKASVNSLNEALLERDGQIGSLNDETVRRGEWALQLKDELENSQHRLQMFVSSNSWRLTRPLREARRWLNMPWQQSVRYLRGFLRLAKRMYQLIPLSYRTKAAHRDLLARYFPKLLLVSGSHSAIISLLALPLINPVIKNSTLNQVALAILINIPTSENPVVSIIIPVYGEIDYTLRCLVSIAKNAPQVAFEIIVVDDFSPDNSAEILAKVKGIKLVINKHNQGFIRSCNEASIAAKGEYLYFLNNDTEVTSDWLDALLRTFQDFPGTGLVGSKLIYPDGRLQEAGGIIWQDGSALNFGRFQDPLIPVYNYARDVDYCSGASIMVPKTIFDNLSGFDELYLPAYYEDSDLAMKIRADGYRVIYQPMSTIFHYEGITSGTDLRQGVKVHQVVNAQKFYTRWKDRLQGYQLPGFDIDNAKDRVASHRVLYLDSCTPTPDQDSGSIDALNHMLLLREMNFQVTFIAEDNLAYMPKYTSDLQRVGVEVLYAPYISSVKQHLIEANDRYDLIFVCRPLVAERCMSMLRKLCPSSKILFHTVDLHFLRMQRQAEITKDLRDIKLAEEMKMREMNLLKDADISTVLSEYELKFLTQHMPTKKVRLLPFSRHIAGTKKTFSERKGIVFIGGFQHSPNVDAVNYFVKEVMPILRKMLPGVCFYVVGSNPTNEIQAFSADDIIIMGFVEELTPLLDKMRVSVAPLRYGAGIKGKIGTSLAVGLPVVATPLAVEGMSLTDGDNVLVAEGAHNFVNAIVSLYKDELIWNRLSQSGVIFAENAWGAITGWKILQQILDDIPIDTVCSNYPLKLYSGEADSSTLVKKNELMPIARLQNRDEFMLVLKSTALQRINSIEQSLLYSANSDSFLADGFCIPCQKNVAMLVDMQSGGQNQNNSWLPNWRERMECPICRMNNRQRLIAALVKQELDQFRKKNVYFMEQVTPIYDWANKIFSKHHIVGSEYLGHQYEGGSVIKGIRHEDVENLSFMDASLDLIVSNDVFEHVPHPAKAFTECARVLKVGGLMLVTIPFHSNIYENVTRAKLLNGKLVNLLPPSYHGNPVAADGSLVFTDFGWNVLDEMRTAGFSDVSVEVYASAKFGHFGGGQLVFRLIK